MAKLNLVVGVSVRGFNKKLPWLKSSRELENRYKTAVTLFSQEAWTYSATSRPKTDQWHLLWSDADHL